MIGLLSYIGLLILGVTLEGCETASGCIRLRSSQPVLLIMITSRDTSATQSILERAKRNPHLVALGALLAIVLLMFADVLFSPGEVVLSKLGTDGDSLFIPWREYGFGQLRQGNLPLWNPHILSGCPFFGSFQSALLYPPNWVHLILPLDKAFNLEIAFHTFLTGLLMYAWTWYRGLSPLASLVAAVLLMFGAPFFFHLYPGHLSPLAVMAWAPLLFLVCDGLATRPSLGWCLLGALGVTMQILGGYPQYFFYTLIAVGVYGLLTFSASPHRVLAVLGTAAMYAAAAALAGVQLFAGLQATGESVRGDRGLPYEIAASFSFPPENLITFLAPNFFGDMTAFPYWGRCYLWEMSLFMGVTGVVLAVCGVVYASGKDRRATLVAVAMVIFLLVLALGAHTPLFKFLYSYVPGFDKFRSNSKFIYPAAIFLTLLSGYGLEYLIQAPRRGRAIGLIVLVVAAVACAGGFWIHSAAAAGPASAWGRMAAAVAGTGESYFPADMYGHPEFLKQAATHAGNSLYVAGAAGVLLAVMLFVANRYPRQVAYGVAGLAILEVFVWSWMNRPTFESGTSAKAGLGTIPQAASRRLSDRQSVGRL